MLNEWEGWWEEATGTHWRDSIATRPAFDRFFLFWAERTAVQKLRADGLSKNKRGEAKRNTDRVALLCFCLYTFRYYAV